MEVIHASARRPTAHALAIARLIGCLYLLTGLSLAWLTLATPFVDIFAARGRAASSETAFHALGWLLALGLPATCLLVGTHRILDVSQLALPFRGRRDALSGLEASLGPEFVAVRDLILPGGRHVSSLIVGPPGIVVLGQVPRAGTVRQVDGRWESRLSDDQWVAIESPLDRAARDAEAVRRWLVADEHGFVVKVYSAVLDPSGIAARTATTAVIAPGQVPDFLARLPPHRTFSSTHRAQVLDRVRSALD